MRKKLSGKALLRPIGFLLRRMLRYPGLMLLTLLINLTAGIIGRKLKRK